MIDIYIKCHKKIIYLMRVEITYLNILNAPIIFCVFIKIKTEKEQTKERKSTRGVMAEQVASSAP
jgi:hypothetical protein